MIPDTAPDMVPPQSWVVSQLSTLGNPLWGPPQHKNCALHGTSTVVIFLNSSTYLILLDVACWLLKLLEGKGSQSTNVSLVPGAGLCIKVREMLHFFSISIMSRIVPWHVYGACSGVWNSANCLLFGLEQVREPLCAPRSSSI